MNQEQEQKQIGYEELHEKAEQAAREGGDLRETIRTMVMNALREGRLETERIRQVIDSVLQGVRKGAEERSQEEHKIKHAMNEAIQGVDEALAATALASKLALQEVKSRFDHFSQNDLAKAEEELKALEEMFIETLDQLVRSASQQLREMFAHLVEHAKTTGTRVGEQVNRSLADLGDQLRREGMRQVDKGVQSVKKTGAQVSDVASGFVASLLDTFRKDKNE